jgi:hypothetical protein
LFCTFVIFCPSSSSTKDKMVVRGTSYVHFMPATTPLSLPHGLSCLVLFL